MSGQPLQSQDCPRVLVVTLNWNGKEVLRRCLQSLADQDYSIERTIVVDNGSYDGSIDMVKQEFPHVVTISLAENQGAPRGRNVGLREALASRPDYVFTLDNDLFVEPPTVGRLVAVLENHTDIGIVGAAIYYADRPDVIASAGGWVNWTQNLVGTRGANQRDTGRLAALADVDYVGTGAMLTRREVYERIGLLDEGFIGYGYEDTEFGMRARKAGYRVVCYLPARVWHAPHTGIGRYSFRKKYLEAINAIRFMRLHGSPLRWVKFSLYASLGLAYAFVVEGRRGNLGGVVGKARGLYDGLCGRENLAQSLLKR